jgi:tetratricopeptide (TPR) repeat protein
MLHEDLVMKLGEGKYEMSCWQFPRDFENSGFLYQAQKLLFKEKFFEEGVDLLIEYQKKANKFQLEILPDEIPFEYLCYYIEKLINLISPTILNLMENLLKSLGLHFNPEKHIYIWDFIHHEELKNSVKRYPKILQHTFNHEKIAALLKGDKNEFEYRYREAYKNAVFNRYFFSDNRDEIGLDNLRTLSIKMLKTLESFSNKEGLPKVRNILIHGCMIILMATKDYTLLLNYVEILILYDDSFLSGKLAHQKILSSLFHIFLAQKNYHKAIDIAKKLIATEGWSLNDKGFIEMKYFYINLLEMNKYYNDAEQEYRELGDLQRSAEMYEKAADEAEKEGNNAQAKEFYSKAAEIYEEIEKSKKTTQEEDKEENKLEGKCPNCGETIEKEDWVVCPNCMTELKTRKCKFCGMRLKSHWKVCPICRK